MFAKMEAGIIIVALKVDNLNTELTSRAVLPN